MFKLFQHQDGIKTEVIPQNSIYTVKELGEYSFEYEAGNNLSKFNNIVFVEDMLLEQRWYNIDGKKINSLKNRFFQDYFGFAALTINNEVFKLNIQIEKLKLSEIEDILMFLWKNENRLFHNFFSKSSVTAQIDKDGTELGLTSKFLAFVEHFYNIFTKLLVYFKNNPHTVIRTKSGIVEYSPQAVTSSTVDWLLNNLDTINFDNSLQGFPDSIKVDNYYGFIDKIETNKSIPSANVYENQIILGAFYSIIRKLNRLKVDIRSSFNEDNFGSDEHIDFRDLKKIPFLKLFDDTKSIEAKLIKLSAQYKHVFKDTIVNDEIPRLTAIFSNKSHYRAAYKIIRESKDLKFNFDGELQLLNIKKLSQLYEAYNLLQIISNVSECIDYKYFERTDTFNTSNETPLRDDGMPSRVSFVNSYCTINIYYELRYPNNQKQTLLTRINTENWAYYEPDYVIEVITKKETTYCIIDSKYTRQHTLRERHVPDCVYKYVLNTGIIGNRYRKIDFLILLYPGDTPEVMLNNPEYSPQILSLPSKPQNEKHLSDFITRFIKDKIPAQLLSDKMRSE